MLVVVVAATAAIQIGVLIAEISVMIGDIDTDKCRRTCQLCECVNVSTIVSILIVIMIVVFIVSVVVVVMVIVIVIIDTVIVVVRVRL